MKRLLLAIACLLPLAGHAQGVPDIGVSGGAIQIGKMQTGFGGKQDMNGDISGQHFATSGAVTMPTISEGVARRGFTPDDYIQTADAGDDSISIQRVINGVCGGALRSSNLSFLSRHYSLRSPINQPCKIDWNGQGWLEQLNGQASIPSAPGTWFDVGPSFASGATAPITLGGSASGSVVRDVAFSEPGQPAPPNPNVNSSGQVIGWPAWAPIAYPPVFNVTQAPGVLFHHLFFPGVYQGVHTEGSGRTSFTDIKGQSFDYLIDMHYAFDVSRIVDIHGGWPFWSSADPVLQYGQAHADVIRSFRNDTPFWDRIFVFGVRSGIAIDTDPQGQSAYLPGGSTTGFALGIISCDFTVHCLWIKPNAASQGHTQSIRSYGQKWDTIAADPVVMMPGSNVMQIDGTGVFQISMMQNFGSDGETINFTSTANGSNIAIGSLYGILTRMSPNSVVARFPTTGGPLSLLSISIPLLTPDHPSGFADTNTSPNGSGQGTMQVGTMTVVH